MAKRPRKNTTHKTPKRTTAKQTGHSPGKSATRSEKPTARSRSTGGSEPVQGAAPAFVKRLGKFEELVVELGLPLLSDSNNVLLFSGELFVGEALDSLPRPRREFRVCCEYRLPTPVIAPFACAFAPAPPAEEDFPPRRTLVVQFGRVGKKYAYVRHEGTGHLSGLAVCRVGDAVSLYQTWLEALAMATQSVNSSPMSPEFFSTVPELDFYDDSSLTVIVKALGIADA